jgi:hypothetical protein
MTIRVPKRGIKIMLVMAVLVAVLAPVAVIAAGGTFTDDDTSVFEADIEWMASTGITFGCNPPANDNYCPTKAVNRGQMAAFMHRLADNQVVDAGELGGFTADSLVRATGTQFPGGGIIILGGTAVPANDTVSFAEVSINAPVDGALVVNGSLNLYCQGALIGCNQSNGNVYVNVDGTNYDRQYYAIDGGSATANGAAWNSSNSAYVPVAAGDHTVTLDVLNNSGSAGSTWVWSGGINVLFVPFGSDGSTPITTSSPALSPAEAGQN